MRFGKPAPFGFVRWVLAERFKWTLAEVDALTLGDLEQLASVDDGRSKAREGEEASRAHFQQTAPMTRGGRRRR